MLSRGATRGLCLLGEGSFGGWAEKPPPPCTHAAGSPAAVPGCLGSVPCWATGCSGEEGLTALFVQGEDGMRCVWPRGACSPPGLAPAHPRVGRETPAGPPPVSCAVLLGGRREPTLPELGGLEKSARAQQSGEEKPAALLLGLHQLQGPSGGVQRPHDRGEWQSAVSGEFFRRAKHVVSLRGPPRRPHIPGLRVPAEAHVGWHRPAELSALFQHSAWGQHKTENPAKYWA